MLEMAVIGAGAIAKTHMKAVLNNPETELKAICDLNLEKAQKAVELLGIADKVKVYTDYMEMAVQEKLDAVIVVTDDKSHRPITVDLLEQGVHVLCEKPMALNVEDCKAMIHTAKTSGKTLMIGQICRFAPSFKRAKQLIEDGAIGELFFVESEYVHDYSIKGDQDWRVDPDRHPIVGGGCHAVDLLRWIAGNPEEVMAYANHKMLPTWPIDDCTIAIMKFPNDVVGKVLCSIGCKRDYSMKSKFYGTKGTILCDNTSSELILYTVEKDENGKDKPGGVPQSIDVHAESHNTVGELAEFVDVVLGKKELAMSGEEGASTVAACLAAVESAKIGLPVKVDYHF